MLSLSRQLLLTKIVSSVNNRVLNFKTSGIVPKIMDKLAAVDIDPEGKFKYILIHVKDGDGNERYLVRGYKSEAYHEKILERCEEAELKALKKSDASIKWKCPGGGSINHKPDHKSILVFGVSQGFGRADHSIATDLIKQKYPDYTKIEWSNEGY